MIKEHKVSQWQAFKAGGIAQSPGRYKPRPKKDDQVIAELQDLVQKHPPISFWQSCYRIRRKGLIWNHKRIYRVYTDLELNVRRRFRRRLSARTKNPLLQPGKMNEVWSVNGKENEILYF